MSSTCVAVTETSGHDGIYHWPGNGSDVEKIGKMQAEKGIFTSSPIPGIIQGYPIISYMRATISIFFVLVLCNGYSTVVLTPP